MALVRHDSREVQFKIVYCGPAQGGKTTSLQYIHRRLDPRWRGDLVSLATDQNRTLSFDFLPMSAMKIAGYRTRFQLYTVPGQDALRETRSSILAGADGVVFVADSTGERISRNIQAQEDLFECLMENRINPASIPIAYQFNKRDLPSAIPPEELDHALSLRTSAFLSSATSGYQIFATLDYVTQRSLKGFHGANVEKAGIAPVHRRHVSLKTTVTSCG
ncbi:MAG: ADP-ribosylation factor-like protein [Verrucomicrobiota bacterium]